MLCYQGGMIYEAKCQKVRHTEKHGRPQIEYVEVVASFFKKKSFSPLWGWGAHPVVVATNRCCCNRNPASSTLVLSSGSAARSSVRRTYIVLITLHMTLFFSILPCAHFLIDGRYLAIVALDNLAFTGTVHTILVGTRTGMSGLHRSGCSSTTQRTSLFKSSWLWVLPASTRSSQHVHLIFTVKGYSFNFRTASNQQNTKRV